MYCQAWLLEWPAKLLGWHWNGAGPVVWRNSEGCQTDSHSDKVTAQTPNVLVYQLHCTRFLFFVSYVSCVSFSFCAFQMLV